MSLVAILDDRATNRHIFSRLAELIEPGVTVKSFADPLEALAWLAEHTPDIVITDFKMPGLDGAEFTRRFRELPECGEVPVVVITVYDERSFRLSALEAGATDFLHSPVDHSEFVTRARNLLKLRKQQQMLQMRAHQLERELRRSEQTREAALRDSHERLAQIIDTVPAMISATDRDGRCIFINTAHAELYGIDSTEVAGKSTAAILGKGRAERSHKLDKLVLEARRALPSYEEEIVDRDGGRRVLLTAKSPIRDLSGEIVSVLTTSLDISDRKRAERHLLHLAHHDSLTDLPNRMLLTQKLGMEMDYARATGGSFALHFIDLDHFKGINDVLGHSVGDRLLSALGRELKRGVRETDVVARLGGDEFAVLQTRIEEPSEAAEMAQRIVEITSQPVEIDGKQIQATGSIGTTLFPLDGNDADELLKNADLAMYRGQGRRRPRLPLLFGRNADGGAADRYARRGPAARRRAPGVRASLPVAGRRQDRAHRRRRGAGPLAHAERRARPAAHLPGARRGQRHDHPHQRMGAAPGLPRRAELAARRPAAHPHRRQHVAGAVPSAECRHADHQHAQGDGPGAVAAGAGDHRKHRDGEHQGAHPRAEAPAPSSACSSPSTISGPATRRSATSRLSRSTG